MSLLIDTYTDSINKYGEELCGHKVEILRTPAQILAIMVAGPGNGVKANISAALTLKMLASMLVQDESIEDAIKSIIDIQPANQSDSSAFAIVQISTDGTGYIAEVDMPAAIVLHHGKPVETVKREILISGKSVREERFTLQPGCILTLFNHGVLNAGLSGRLKAGWGRQLVANYLHAAYKHSITAEKITTLLLTAGSSLDDGRPADDLAVVTFRTSLASSSKAG